MAMAIVSAATHAETGRASETSFHIAAIRLGPAIAELSRQAGVSIGSPSGLPDIRTPPVHGRMRVGEALRRLLAGSGLHAVQAGEHAWRIERAPMAAQPAPHTQQPRHDVAPAIPAASPVDEPIVVTALKRPILAEAAPVAISAVDIAALDALRPGTATARIAEQVEGLSITALGPGRNRLFLRGVADSAFSGESQSTVATLVDGARVTFAAPDPDLRLVDVERVELLKGPQGALYGAGTLGGIVNIVTRQPDPEDASLTTAITMDGIQGGQWRPGGSVVANLPLVSGQAGLRLVGYSAQSPGWVDTGDRVNSNRHRVLGTRGVFSTAWGSGWTMTASAMSQWLSTHDSQYVYRPGARSRPAQLAEPHDNDLQQGAVRITGPTGVGELTLLTSFSKHEVGDTLDATIGADSFGLSAPQTLEDERQYHVWDNEARLAGQWGNASWQLGVVWLMARQSEVAVLQGSGDESLTVDDDHRTTRELAVFGDASLPIAANLTLDVGGRLFHQLVRERRLIADTPVTRQREHTGFTPTVSLSWQASEHHFLWVRYASAQRAGGSDIGPTGDLELLDGDDLNSLEAGWRGQLSPGLHVDVGSWLSRWTHIQSDILLPNGLIETVNAGNATLAGVEATLTARLSARWRLVLGGNLNEARLTSSTLDFEVEDNSLPIVPRYTARVSLNRDFVLGAGGEASLSFGLRYVGPSHLSFDPDIDRPMGRALESRIDGSWRSGPWLAALSLTNILGGEANRFAYGNPFRFRTMRQYTPPQPRSLILTLSRAF